METPRIVRGRTPTRTPINSEVRHYHYRNRLFSPDDSGFGRSPATGTPRDIHTETMRGMPYRRRAGQSSPRDAPGRDVQEDNHMTETVIDKRNSWRKFWLIWVGLLSVCSGMVAVAWVYFPNNKVVQRSQEYVMSGLLVIIGLIVFTIVFKLIWHYVFGTHDIYDTPPARSENMRDPNYGFSGYPDNVGEDELANSSIRGQLYSPKITSEGPTEWNARCTTNGHRQPPVGLPGQNYGQCNNSHRATDESGFSNRTYISPMIKPKMENTAMHEDEGRGTMQLFNQPETAEVDNRYCNQGKEPVLENIPHTQEYSVRRTFSGTSTDVWNDFLQYFENLAGLNRWNAEKSRRVLLSTLRGQAETYAYGIPLVIQRDYNRLKEKMGERFGHTAMKERYVTEAKLRKRQPNESLRDFGQAIEDLYRRAYPSSPEIVEESAIKSFLDKCGQAEDFRLAVKRTRPKTLQDAVLSAMQEECLRAGEKDLAKDGKIVNRQIYEVDDGGDIQDVATNGNSRTIGSTDHEANNRSIEKSPHSYPYDSGRGYRGRPYSRGNARGRGRYPRYDNRSQNFRGREEPRRDFDARPLN